MITMDDLLMWLCVASSFQFRFSHSRLADASLNPSWLAFADAML
jgi:hypothetical protein